MARLPGAFVLAHYSLVLLCVVVCLFVCLFARLFVCFWSLGYKELCTQ